ncbi:hypothetical protein DPMN_094908, partial [Dreissena polymorpha]
MPGCTGKNTCLDWQEHLCKLERMPVFIGKNNARVYWHERLCIGKNAHVYWRERLCELNRMPVCIGKNA